MPAIEDYLRAIAFLLPRAQREDIVAELRDIVLTRIEAREAELGRPLTLEETEAVLRAVGHPVVVAARYRGGPQHVIGPALYPYWWIGVKVALTIQLAIAVVAFVIRSVTGGDVALAFGHAIGAAIAGSVTLIGCATLAAWIVERQGVHIDYFDRWRVRDLRFLQFAARDWQSLSDRVKAGRRGAPPSDHQRPRGRMRRRSLRRSPAARGLGLIALGAVIALWWTGIFNFSVIGDLADLRDLGIEPGSLATVDWGAVRDTVYWSVLVYAMMITLQGATLLAWPDQHRLHGLGDILIGLGLLTTTAWLWSASPIAAATHVDSLIGFARAMKSAFHGGPPFPLAGVLTFALAATAFGALWRIVRGVWKLLLPETAEGWGGSVWRA